MFVSTTAKIGPLTALVLQESILSHGCHLDPALRMKVSAVIGVLAEEAKVRGAAVSMEDALSTINAGGRVKGIGAAYSRLLQTIVSHNGDLTKLIRPE